MCSSVLLLNVVNVVSNSNWACQFFKLGADNLPCLDALVDSYQFLVTMLDNDLSEIRAVHAGYLIMRQTGMMSYYCNVLFSDMASISNIRQSRTAITLSLVATVFLPMTFLTGVFGMNFQFAGGDGTYVLI
jgi:Mg2+ and Co2+ transporter CorA